jgi:hypothetical protein
MDAIRANRADGKPFWSQGPQLVDQIGNLFGSIDSQFTSPTRAQLEFLAELRREYELKVEELVKYFEESVPELNAQLTTSGVPALAVATFPPAE